MQPQSNAAIDPLIQDNWPKLKRFFRAKVPEPDCYELVQDTLMEFVKKHREKVLDNPRAYLWGIARFKVLKYIGGKRSATAEFDSKIHSVMGPQTTLSVRFDRRDKLMNALRSLTAEQQIAFELHYGEGMTNEEVAQTMELSPATAKRRIKEAREQLQILLANSSHLEIADAYRSG
jgi:RNA polymerase sigma factor (sigma-70 family)